MTVSRPSGMNLKEGEEIEIGYPVFGQVIGGKQQETISSDGLIENLFTNIHNHSLWLPFLESIDKSL